MRRGEVPGLVVVQGLGEGQKCSECSSEQEAEDAARFEVGPKVRLERRS